MGTRSRRVLCALGLAAAIAAAAAGSPASSATCVYPAAYPGDDGAKDKIAAWMAGGAKQAGLPGELPVMGAIVSSDVRNLKYGDSDSVGYFQMRTAIWNQGDYAGFPDHPELQLGWFIDQAQAVRQRAIAGGDSQYGQDPAKWGIWVADVERPAEQYRGAFQPKLGQARDLIAAGCAAPDPEPGATPGETAPEQSPGEGGAQLIPDSVLPDLDLGARRRQSTARSRDVVLTATCANEGCFARPNGTVAVPGRGLFAIRAKGRKLARGKRAEFRMALGARAVKAIAAALRAGDCSQAVVRVVAANAGGYRISASRSVVLGPARTCG